MSAIFGKLPGGGYVEIAGSADGRLSVSIDTTVLDAMLTALQSLAVSTAPEEITPSDATTFTATRGLYVGAGGDVKVDTAEAVGVTFRNALSGAVLPVAVTRVYATGTTAAGLVGLR
jgi:hypothetical protein